MGSEARLGERSSVDDDDPVTLREKQLLEMIETVRSEAYEKIRAYVTELNELRTRRRAAVIGVGPSGSFSLIGPLIGY